MLGGLILYLSWHPASPFNIGGTISNATKFKTKEEQDAFNQGQKDAPSIIDKKTAPGYWPTVIPGGAGGGNLSVTYPDYLYRNEGTNSYTVI